MEFVVTHICMRAHARACHASPSKNHHVNQAGRMAVRKEQASATGGRHKRHMRAEVTEYAENHLSWLFKFCACVRRPSRQEFVECGGELSGEPHPRQPPFSIHTQTCTHTHVHKSVFFIVFFGTIVCFVKTHILWTTAEIHTKHVRTE